jgi:RNA polymerase sigma-70 factor (ECF subfamily)
MSTSGDECCSSGWCHGEPIRFIASAGPRCVTNRGAAALLVGAGKGRLRATGAKATIHALSLRPRFAFDGEYVRRLIAEDPETERHFTEYFGDLLSLKLRSRLRSPALVEDARQETFVRVLIALKKKGSLATAESLGAFVNAVCNNVLLETYRSKSRTSALDDEVDEPEAGEPSVEWRVLKEEEGARVRDAIAGLPEKDRDLIRWLFFEDRPKDDICRELNVDRAYLRVLFHRAKQRFRERFSAEEQQK